MVHPAKAQTVGVEPDSLLTRHEVRRGLAAKRARAQLCLIETWTARPPQARHLSEGLQQAPPERPLVHATQSRTSGRQPKDPNRTRTAP